MSRKIISKEKQRNLTELEISSFGEVERGETTFKLDKLKDFSIAEGELPFYYANFDAVVNLGKARIVGEASFLLENFDTPAEPEPQEPPKDDSNNEEASDLEFKEPVFEEIQLEEVQPEVEEKNTIDEEKLQELLKAEYDRAFAEGVKKGAADEAAKGRKQYEKEQKDYIDMLESTYKEVIARTSVFSAAVKELDSALPEMLTHFLESFIGAERVTNGNLVVSVIRKSLSAIHELSHVVFKVSLYDLETVRMAFPDYESQADPALQRGSVKIVTNIGEMDYTIETMMENFKKLIHEELESPETDKR